MAPDVRRRRPGYSICTVKPRTELLPQTYEQFPLGLHTADKYGNYAASLAAAAQTPLPSRLHPAPLFQAGYVRGEI